MDSVLMEGLKRFLFVLVALVLIAWGIHAAMNFGCETQIIAARRLAAADVEIIYMNCDTLAKTELIEVYLMNPGEHRWPAILGWIHQRTLVFRYDPAGIDGRDGPGSQVTEDTAGFHAIVPHVSSVQLKEDAWGGRSSGYSIEKIDYP
jgi:hypothetical protein